MCSDAMTRGMDVAGVAAVVNYDAPVYVKTYVHRAGRTARAGEAAGALWGCGPALREGRAATSCVGCPLLLRVLVLASSRPPAPPHLTTTLAPPHHHPRPTPV